MATCYKADELDVKTNDRVLRDSLFKERTLRPTWELEPTM